MSFRELATIVLRPQYQEFIDGCITLDRQRPELLSSTPEQYCSDFSLMSGWYNLEKYKEPITIWDFGAGIPTAVEGLTQQFPHIRWAAINGWDPQPGIQWRVPFFEGRIESFFQNDTLRQQLQDAQLYPPHIILLHNTLLYTEVWERNIPQLTGLTVFTIGTLCHIVGKGGKLYIYDEKAARDTNPMPAISGYTSTGTERIIVENTTYRVYEKACAALYPHGIDTERIFFLSDAPEGEPYRVGMEISVRGITDHSAQLTQGLVP